MTTKRLTLGELLENRAVNIVINNAQKTLTNPKASTREKVEAAAVIEQFNQPK